MMRQWRAIKRQYPEYILLFRLGDFYEMFYEDAKVASSVLSIALTSRAGGKASAAAGASGETAVSSDACTAMSSSPPAAAPAAAAGSSASARKRAVPMCGIPHHALSTYLKRLVQHGLLVAICEQVEPGSQQQQQQHTSPSIPAGDVTASSSSNSRRGRKATAASSSVMWPGNTPPLVSSSTTKLMHRAVQRLVTPGTLIEDMYLNPKQHNYLLAIAHASPSTTLSSGARTAVNASDLGLAWVDVSTGQFYVGRCAASALSQELARVEPSEVLIAPELLRLHPSLRGVLPLNVTAVSDTQSQASHSAAKQAEEEEEEDDDHQSAEPRFPAVTAVPISPGSSGTFRLTPRPAKCFDPRSARALLQQARLGLGQDGPGTV